MYFNIKTPLTLTEITRTSTITSIIAIVIVVVSYKRMNMHIQHINKLPFIYLTKLISYKINNNYNEK